ncbi:glycoside hydrolase family 3 N-terminal domain-containing protein [Flavivirga spongiicola]|uniref:Glycoside hydrolase family 3 C-terminal domain-containing protein n=1 Tax=Flavivirga spongiicola TaxID=421621 RepID=A0ABU7XXZ9_9FLAO|nr:glycoside hydrolase family 3 N-terminal domain-containing protein [Flavivirga sp. MEBiC05379]MDO5980270.1 glycoside hydrolase family 3 N-terminal domain-containing protein [Flavivirga sp. MEBiC05379]
MNFFCKNFFFIVLVLNASLSAQTKKIYHKDWIDFNKNGTKDIYEDQTKDVEERINNLVSLMTMEEKTMQLVTLYGYGRVATDELPTRSWKNELWKDGLANIDEASNGVSKKAKYTFPYSKHVWALNKIQTFFVEETRLGIPVEFTNEGIRGLNHVKATSFPAQIGMGSTWNPELLYKVGQVIGKEAYALGYNNIYSPVLDVARDQRWGRIVESFGEDPFLVSEYGVQISKGIQEQGVVNTLKHYAVYSAPKGGRDGNVRVDPHITWRDMHLMYLYPFKRAIQETNIMGVMSSYNDYDGDPITGSHYFLTELLRDTYGFKGYVVSDSEALAYLHYQHHVVDSYKQAVLKAITAGLNVRTTFNPPNKFIEPLRELVYEGTIPMALLDQRVKEVLHVKFKEGLFDKPYKEAALADKVVKTDAHKALSLQASRESIILLKNANNTLPLDKNKLKNVLVCGPTAKDTISSVSRYGALRTHTVSGYEGIVNHLKDKVEVTFAEGIDIKDENWPDSEVFDIPLNDEEKTMIADAVTKAEKTDAIILFVGEEKEMVGENLSRTSLDLPGHQQKLITALSKTGKPLIVVLINGHPLSVNYADRQADAILQGWFPGEFGGQAIAEIIFGNYNPGGHLPVTMLKTVGQIPFNFPYKPNAHAGQAKEGPNGTGKSRIVTELYPFGHGLSYTTFGYSNLKINNKLTTKSGTLTVNFEVENTGDRAGDVVPQFYINDEVSSLTVYKWQLRGFKRIHLKPNEKRTVSFTITPKALEFINLDREFVVEKGVFNIAIGNSSTDFQLKGSFNIDE